MSDINLDQLMASKSAGTLGTAGQQDNGNTELVRAEQATQLTMEDRAAIDKIKSTVDLKNAQTSIVYASQTQKDLADFSGSILSTVKNASLGDSGKILSNLLSTIQGFNIGELEERSFLENLFQRGKNKISKLFGKYQIVESQVDKIVAELETASDVLMKDIIMYDKLYEQNLSYFHELQLYIAAGDEIVQDMRERTLPALREEAAQSGEPMAAQVVRDFEQNVDRFEKKVYDLKTSKVVALQSAPQIRLIQNNDKLLMDKIQESIHTTIPFWKSQMIIALGLEHQSKIVAMQKEISDTTNRMIRENADKLKQNTLEVAREAERSIVDIEAIKHANERLIETINESISIHEQARTARTEAEKELRLIEDNLRSAVLSASQRGRSN
jgi:uncharacterized protein YaaN involved in tellurite resistance